MSADKNNNEDDIRVIPVRESGAPMEEREGENEPGELPKLPPNPELESAMRDALDSLERDSRLKAMAEREMSQNERENYQGRIKDLHIKMAEQEKQLNEAKDLAMRAQAELENYKKRVQRERAEQFNYGNEEIASAFLDVLDNLERALQHSEEADPQSIIEGVKLTHRMMLQAFERFGITPIKALGEKFDPNYHEAVAQVPRDDVEPGTVVEEHKRGYMLKDRLLRPSMVVVAGKPS